MSWTGPIFIVAAGADSDLSATGPGVLVQPVHAGAVALVDAPIVDSLFGWDNTDGAFCNIIIGGNLTYDHATHTLAATGGGGAGSSPLIAKGDLWGFSTVDARIPIGADGKVLTADSTQALGLAWVTPASLENSAGLAAALEAMGIL